MKSLGTQDFLKSSSNGTEREREADLQRKWKSKSSRIITAIWEAMFIKNQFQGLFCRYN